MSFRSSQWQTFLRSHHYAKHLLWFINLTITGIARSFHIFMLWQSGWQIITFLSRNLNQKIKIIKYKSRFYDKKVVIYHPLCHNINMLKLLVILVVIKLYARIDILNINFWILWLSFLISFKMINFRSNFMQLFLASFMKISSFNSFKYFCHRLISVLI